MTFEKGNQLHKERKSTRNAGRKPNEVKALYQRVMEKTCKEEDLETIFEVAVHRAKTGDSDARNFVYDRMFGKPISELDRAIINAIQAERGELADAET